MVGTPIGETGAPSWFSFRAVARTSAIIAGSAASGLAGGTGIHKSSPPSLPGYIETTGLR